MAKYKPYDYRQTMLIAISLEEQLMPGTLEFAIHELVDNHIDTTIFDQKYRNDDTGCRAYAPSILLKIVLLAYSRGIIGSRRIERACRENITFMALSCGQSPDHSTIAAFISQMKDEIISIFRDVLLVCADQGLLGGTHFSLDGLKLPSNAAKEWSGRFSELTHKQKKLEEKVSKLLAAHHQSDRTSTGTDDATDTQSREKRIERLKRQAQRIEKFLSENQPKAGKRRKENQSNVTDNESGKMMTSHGTIQGYNAQALVDSKHQIILHGQALGSGQDYDHITPVLDSAKAHAEEIGLGADYFRNKTLTADPNYHSERNLKKCEAEGLDAYIPDVNYRKRDPLFQTQHRHRMRRKKKARLSVEAFCYDEASDTYRCPEGKLLKLRARQHRLGDNIFRRYQAQQSDCQDCVLKKDCLQTKNTRARTLSILAKSITPTLSHKMIDKIDQPVARQIYSQRLGIVEPVFSNIRIQKGLDKFTLRSQVKVSIQWLLYCMVHNIEKILHYGQSETAAFT